MSVLLNLVQYVVTGFMERTGIVLAAKSVSV